MSIWQTLKLRLCAALFVGLLWQPAFAAATVSTTATPSPAVVGSPANVKVMITGIVDLFGFQFSLAFNPAVLQAIGLTEGTFLAAGGATTFGTSGIDNVGGKVNFVFNALDNAVPGVSGSGLLATITFSAVAIGSSPLSFSDVLFIDSALNDITVSATNGVLQVVAIPEPAGFALLGFGLIALVAARRYQRVKP